MATIAVSVVVPAAPAVVWEDLRHIERHAEWMSEAESIRFLTDSTTGAGTRFECVTVLGPLRLTDRMEVTEWLEGEAMEIRHTGVVTGVGRFRLAACEGPNGAVHTCFDWTETLRFPWWMGGPFAAAAARPVLGAVWRRNVRTLAARFSPSR